ncbi:MAG TPA: MbcA/ParS/Xre antitoxin family protein, partial [Gammaproteobacteria bacterium]|nr:MbcA/ParS/Xre antitoxin family protein [Gammaproteobacteria bacterium]
AANEWIKKPNSAPLFNGRSALDKMLAGKVIDLADVRRYLDAERGG